MYKKSKQTWAKHWDFVLWDIIALIISYFIAYVVRFGPHIYSYQQELLIQMGVVLVLIYFCVSLLGHSYKNIIHRNRYQELRSVIVQVLVSYAIITIYLYLVKDADDFSRQVYLVSGVLSVILIYGERIVWKRILRLRRLNSKIQPKLLLITQSDKVENNLRAIRIQRYNDFAVSGIVIMDQDMQGESFEGIPVVANATSLKKYVLAEVVDEVLIDLYDTSQTDALMEYFLMAGITVHAVLLSNAMDLPNKHVEKVGGHMVLTTTNNLASGWQLVGKRILDIIGGIVGLAFTGVIYLIVAPKIKKIDPGPIFFSQTRVGQNGRKFKIYKFRSMYMDAEARKNELMAQNQMEGLMFKMDNDPRILPGIGHKIRDWSLDEFPQFLNVLKGDMSLVGTRPPTVDEFNEYEVHHKMRLAFKPGITGMWQVSGRSNIKDFEEIVRLDSEYIKNWSLRMDIKIILKTIKVVLHKDGSM